MKTQAFIHFKWMQFMVHKLYLSEVDTETVDGIRCLEQHLAQHRVAPGWAAASVAVSPWSSPLNAQSLSRHSSARALTRAAGRNASFCLGHF